MAFRSIPTADQCLQVTDCSVYLLKDEIPSFKAFASVTLNGQIKLNDIRVQIGSIGEIVVFPSARNSVFSVYFPITRELRDVISDAVISKYHEEVLSREARKSTAPDPR